MQVKDIEVSHGHGASVKRGIIKALQEDLEKHGAKETSHVTHSSSEKKGFEIGQQLIKDIKQQEK